MMTTDNWLLQKMKFFNLTPEECAEILDFTFLWSLLENKCLNCYASPRKLNALSQSCVRSGRLDIGALKQTLSYFQTRYTKAGKFTHHFDFLNLRDNDNKNLVKAVLLGNAATDEQVVTALLTIVYRYRNNLFHGEKWQYNIQGQLENFKHANFVLKSILDLHWRLREIS